MLEVEKIICAIIIAGILVCMVIVPFTISFLYSIEIDTQVKCKVVQIAHGYLALRYDYYAVGIDGKIYKITKEDWDSLNVSICRYED